MAFMGYEILVREEPSGFLINKIINLSIHPPIYLSIYLQFQFQFMFNVNFNFKKYFGYLPVPVGISKRRKRPQSTP